MSLILLHQFSSVYCLEVVDSIFLASIYSAFLPINRITNLFADLLDVLPEKRKPEDGGYSSDDGPEVLITTLSLLVPY